MKIPNNQLTVLKLKFQPDSVSSEFSDLTLDPNVINNNSTGN